MTPNPQTASAALTPPAAMAPPGACRGAVSAWPQLLRAFDSISAHPMAAAKLKSQYSASFGSPAALMGALAVHPAILLEPQPPSDIYAQFVWFATRMSSATRTMGRTLAQLPVLTSASAGATQESTGKLVAEALTGPGGLKQTADTMASMTGDLVRRIGALEGGLDAALADFRSAGTRLNQHASAVTALKAQELAHFQSTAATAAQGMRADLDDLELAGANVAVNAIMENLIAALQTIAGAWQTASEGLAAAVSAASPEQLANLDYLRNTLDLDRAVEEWNGFADMIQPFIQRLLVTK